jgi:hypothetical protein
MGKRNIAFYYEKLSPEDQHTFNRWLKANAIGGAIFAIALIAMALAGSRSAVPRDGEVASKHESFGRCRIRTAPQATRCSDQPRTPRSDGNYFD